MWFCQRKLVVCGNFGTLGTNHNGLSFNVVNRVEDLMLSISYYFLKQRQIRQCLHLRYSQQFEKYSPIMTSWVLLTCPNLYLICVKSLFNLLVSIFLRFAQVEQPCDTTTMERGHENQAIQDRARGRNKTRMNKNQHSSGLRQRSRTKLKIHKSIMYMPLKLFKLLKKFHYYNCKSEPKIWKSFDLHCRNITKNVRFNTNF